MAKVRTTHHDQHALAYAQALLDLANEREQTDAIAAELRQLRQVIEADPLFGAFLKDPGVGQRQRQEVFERALSGKASVLMMNFLQAVNGRGHSGLLPKISAAYDDLLDRQRGKVDVELTVAQDLDGELLQQVQERVSAALRKNAVVHQRVDESIIGGLVLQVEDRLIDASVRSQLEAMRQQMRVGRR